MDGKKRSAKQNRHTGGKVAGGAALLALLLAGGHFGLGIGREGGGFLTAENIQTATETVVQGVESAREALTEAVEQTGETVTETVQQIVVPQDDGVLTITVKEDKLLYEGQETTLVQLEESLLKDYRAGVSTVELKDDHAIKSAYDEVSALLQKLSIPYSEGK